MKRLKYLALATLVAFAACDEGEDLAPTDGGEEVTITGTVNVTVSDEDGNGLANVVVNLVGPTTGSQTTGASGAVSFSNVEGGAYAVSISEIPVGFVCTNTSKTTNITQQGQSQDVTFSCDIVRTASISGQVTSDGAAVEGAEVEISGPEGDEQTFTGAQGTYQFTGLRKGSYTATLQADTIGGVICEEATSNLDLSPGESAVANFACAGGQVQPASVAIERITTPAGVAVDRTSVVGMIVIQVGVDEGGQDVDTVRVWLNDIEICTQEFDEATPVAGGGPAGVEEEFEIDCVVNTASIRDISGAPPAQYDDAGAGNPFAPIWLNGTMNIVAEAIIDGQTEDHPDAREAVTLVNADRLALNVENDNGDAPDFLIKASTGLRWLSGSLTFTVYPIIYSAPFDPNNPAIARANFGFDSYVSGESTAQFTNDAATDSRPLVGAAAVPANWSLSSQTPNADGSFTFTLADHLLIGAFAGGVFNIGNGGGSRDMITGTFGAQNIRISTITAFGQNGPGVICANISTTCAGTGGTVLANPLTVHYQGVLQSGTGATNNVLRVDNQEPWANIIELSAHPLRSLFPAPSAGIVTNGTSAVRGGFNFNGLRDGWVNHDYAFTASMWAGTTPFTAGLVGSGVIAAGTTYPGATDAPNVYPGHPNLVTLANPAGVPDPSVAVGVTALAGIGLAASPVEGFYAAASDASNASSAFTITGIGTNRQRLESLTGTKVATGADLPGETGLGLDALTAPNTNEADDASVVAVVYDLFENAGLTNIIEVGVDGQAPVFAGLNDPTGGAATAYNTYGTRQASNASNYSAVATLVCTPFPNQVCTTAKTAGEYTGTTTDTNNGFSGVAGVSISDWENGCAAGVTACAGSFRNERTGVTMQSAAVLAPTATLAFEWSIDAALPVDQLGGTGNSFEEPIAAARIYAYDATAGTAATNDGYRQQQVTTWDRAANAALATAVPEHIADKTRPLVGNVEMPTVTQFTLGTNYTFRGENADAVDLRVSDFGFDYNTITSVQPYSDPAAGTTFKPSADAYGNGYINNPGGGPNATGNSLQLPWSEIDHTTFGSASILLASNLETAVEFVGCIALFDEGGAPDGSTAQPSSNPAFVHIPRGPRWRTWEHAYPYGLANTQFNTFTPTSVPTANQTTCANGMSANAIRAQILPSANTVGAWNFGIGVQTGGAVLELTTSGQSGTFVPNFDITAVDLYYIDGEGRVRILDTSGANWTGPVVTDVGTGALGRTYTWTWSGTLPTDTTLPADYEHGDPYVFVLRAGNGTAIMWDDSANN